MRNNNYAQYLEVATNGSLLYFSSGKTQNNASVYDRKQQVQPNY